MCLLQSSIADLEKSKHFLNKTFSKSKLGCDLLGQANKVLVRRAADEAALNALRSIIAPAAVSVNEFTPGFWQKGK